MKTPRIKNNKRQAPKSALAIKIVQTSLRQDVSVEQLGALAQSDPAFAMRLLSIVNSAGFGLKNRVESVSQGAAMLGVSGLRNIGLSMSVVDMTPTGPDGAVLLGCCLRRAVAARMLSRHLGMRRDDDYFTAGLFLECGLLQHANEHMKDIAEIARLPAASRIVHERAAGLLPHSEEGAALAKRWSLSQATIEAIDKHHDPDPPQEVFARVAWVAERFAAVFEGGILDVLKEQAAEGLKVLDLPVALLDELLLELSVSVVDAAKAFDRVVEQPDLDSLLRDANEQLVDLNRNFQCALRRLETLLVEKEKLAAELSEANVMLERMASTDGLTGLCNHKTFREALTRDISRAVRAGEPISVVMMDVDHFKIFNDTYGHLAGDVVLRAVADILRESTRLGDVPARYGGEEFAVILPSTDSDSAKIVAERIRHRLAERHVDLGDQRVQVTASFGVSTANVGDLPVQPDALVGTADAALYRSKHDGRNRVSVGILGEEDHRSESASHARDPRPTGVAEIANAC